MAPRRKKTNLSIRNVRRDVIDNPIVKQKSTRANTGKTECTDKAVEEWVYRFLGNLAAIENDKKESNKHVHLRFQNSNQPRKKKSTYRRFRSPTPYSWDRISSRPEVHQDNMNSDISVDEDLDQDYSEIGSRSSMASSQLYDDQEKPLTSIPKKKDNNKKLKKPKKQTKNTEKSTDENTLLQRINGYIKAGIAEGKRRARRYVRKALSFAMETGYLIPADREGRLLRVSPALISQAKPALKAQVTDAQRRRKRATLSHSHTDATRRKTRKRTKTMKVDRKKSKRRRIISSNRRFIDDKSIEGKMKSHKREKDNNDKNSTNKDKLDQKNDNDNLHKEVSKTSTRTQIKTEQESNKRKSRNSDESESKSSKGKPASSIRRTQEKKTDNNN